MESHTMIPDYTAPPLGGIVISYARHLPRGHSAIGIVALTLSSLRLHCGHPHPVQYPTCGGTVIDLSRYSHPRHVALRFSTSSGAILQKYRDISATVYCAILPSSELR